VSTRIHSAPIAPGPSLVLTFHGIGAPGRELDPGEDQVWVTRDNFERILDAVVDKPQVEITFDDGNASDIDIAVPALRDRGLRATFFVLAGRLDEPGALGREDLREMVRSGMDIGSHGMSHRPWRRLDAATAAREIVQAKARLEAELGQPVTQAACPFGAYDRRTLEFARAAGIETLFTSDGGVSPRGQWLRARNTIHAHDSSATVADLLRMRAFDLPEWKRRAKTFVKRLR